MSTTHTLQLELLGRAGAKDSVSGGDLGRQISCMYNRDQMATNISWTTKEKQNPPWKSPWVAGGGSIGVDAVAQGIAI